MYFNQGLVELSKETLASPTCIYSFHYITLFVQTFNSFGNINLLIN